jgi:phosphomannomutase
MVDAKLLAIAERWVTQDPDPKTVAEVGALIAAEDEAGLQDRFGSRLTFGTAGLRGELGAGPNRMNRVVIGQAAIGLVHYLLANFDEPTLVVGFDGRVNSDVFARDTAELATALGVRVKLFSGMVPTPMLAFAVKQLGASAGVMVTASHNPPNDNGYKVYLGGANGGSQIIPPVDAAIHAEIVTVAESVLINQAERSEQYEHIGEEVAAAYRESVSRLVGGKPANQPKLVYTAMHGVGWATASKLLADAGFAEIHSVREQQEPDGSFPTVAFPNPEEPGALDLSLALAEKVNADLILANDPDADRLCVVVRQNGQLRRLTGDETGLLLGEWAAKRSYGVGTMANSVVSCEALAKVAQHYGLGFEQTKTGFKWISKVPGLIFGFEEALGYCIDPNVVPDKDGISAALVIASMAAERNLGDLLDELYERYGFFATGQVSIRFESVAKAKNAFAAATTGMQAEGDMVFWRPDESSRVIFRVSGTEPKLKCYLQVIGGSADDSAARLAALEIKVREKLDSNG